MAVMPKLDEANLQAICDILGATDTGLTGPKIGRYLQKCDCPDPAPGITSGTGFMHAVVTENSIRVENAEVPSIHEILSLPR
jgi:hypothetical protein